MFTCPYCHQKAVPAPDNSRYQSCSSCGKRSRKAISYTTRDGKPIMLVKYVATGKKHIEAKSITLIKRVSPREVQDVVSGRAQLVISNNRLQLQYKQ